MNTIANPPRLWESRVFWGGLIIASLLALVAAFKLMYGVLPSLKADITYTREQAITSSEMLQKHLFPDVKTDRVAVSFNTDRQLQTYVELEGGGVAAFNSQINNPDVAPYAWTVRRFAEAQEKEVWVSYSPSGAPLSYSLNLPQQEPGAALDADTARAIAEAGVRDFWGARFAAYKAFDTKLVRQTSGRVDHVFTYEHQTLMLGEANFRVELVVAGDKLIAVRPFNHVPDAFLQRFGEMRALNDQINTIARYFMFGLFAFGGIVVGGLWLHRRHQLQWRAALVPTGILISVLIVAIVSNLPLSWFSYQTTTSVNNFFLQYFVGAAGSVLWSFVYFGCTFLVAEGLSRLAFTNQPRVFDFFRPALVSSTPAFGRILGAYIWVGFFLFYAMLFVVLSRQYLGWWSPSDLSSDPNILASWRPALGPIFTALQAGTTEECLFRAIPLAAASLIGARLGIRNPLVIFVLIAQAFIFGGAHAFYSNLPGYSRLVELFVPAVVFGVVFLRFGLVPGMIAHFIYDLVLMSLPIFASADPHLLVDKVLVVLTGSVPLLIAAWARYHCGAATELPVQWRNASLTAQVDSQHTEVHLVADAVISVESMVTPVAPCAYGLSAKAMAVLVIASLTILMFSWKKAPDVAWPPFEVDRQHALQLAQTELTKRGVVLQGEWRSTVLTGQGWWSQRDFVWRESGKSVFQHLLGQFLDTAYWEVSWRKFDGPVELRTEKWLVLLRPDGSVYDVVHDLPEAAPGASLTREQASSMAMQWIVANHWAATNDLEEKSLEQTVRPHRSDWRVTFADKSAFNEHQGTAVIKVTLNGDQVTASLRSIDIPQEWQRADAEAQAKKSPFAMAGSIALVVLAILVLSTYIRKHQGRAFNLWIALPWVAVIVVAALVDALLWVDALSQGFNTAMSWSTQVWTAIARNMIYAVVFSVAALITLQAVYAERPLHGARPSSDFLLGVVVAMALAALRALVELVIPSQATPSPNTGEFAAYIPWLATTINELKSYYLVIFTLIFAIGFVRFNRSRLRLSLMSILVVIWWLCSSYADREIVLSFASQAIAILSAAAIVFFVARKQMGVAMTLVGMASVFHLSSKLSAIYDVAWLHALIAGVITAALTYVLVWHWHRKNIA